MRNIFNKHWGAIAGFLILTVISLSVINLKADPVQQLTGNNVWYFGGTGAATNPPPQWIKNTSGGTARFDTLADEVRAIAGLQGTSIYLRNTETTDQITSAVSLVSASRAGGAAQANITNVEGHIPVVPYVSRTDGSGWSQVAGALNSDASNMFGVMSVAPATYNSDPDTYSRWRGGSTPMQGGSGNGTILNFNINSNPDTALVQILAAGSRGRLHLHGIDSWCTAGSATLTVTDNATVIWTSQTGEIGTAAFRANWSPALTGLANNTSMTITLSSCGVGNTGKLIIQADRF